jgi:hypothetical protein
VFPQTKVTRHDARHIGIDNRTRLSVGEGKHGICDVVGNPGELH